MTNQQILEVLKDKGFRAVIRHNFVIVYRFISRQITSVEVADALGIDSDFCQRHGSSIVIYGVDA